MIKEILIVEDDVRTRNTIEKFCCSIPIAEGALFIHADNGLDAYRVLGERQPDIMFLDMELPGVNGRELLDMLMLNQFSINIVIISGYDSFEYTKKAIQYGTIDYLLKPVNRRQIHQVLERIDKSDYLCRKKYGKLPPLDIVMKDSKNGVGMMEEIKDYIDTNFTEQITLSELSQRFHYSREYISREFKRQFGMGIIKYMNEVRLERARIYLTRGVSPHEAGAKVGFLDDSYFSRLFKDKFGSTPKKYQI